MHGSVFVADLALVLCVAALTAVVARAARQSTVLGYLAAGLIVGPYIPIPVFADPERVGALADFGVVLVMFAVGLEFRIAKFLRVLPVSGLTGVLQVGFLAWCGFSLGQLLDWGTVESVFLGACIAISSTMVVSKVFEQVTVARDVREHVFGVLVVQDVLAIALIAAMTVVALGGGLAPADVVATLAQLVAVLLVMTVGGLLAVPRMIRAVVRTRNRELMAVVSIGLCFGLALLAQELGYSVALGAFIAGVLVSESGRAARIEPILQPLRDVFAAVFFVSIGMTVDPRLAMQVLPSSLLIFVVVIVAQLASVSSAGLLSGLGLRRSLTAGLALGQIGEFAFILAAIGIQAGAVRPELQPILVTVAVLTSFTTPLFLGAADRVVHSVDRRLPARIRALLSLYEAWLERFHAGQTDPERRTPVRRALRALAFDGVGLVLLLGASVAWLPDVMVWVEAQFQISASIAPYAVVFAVLAIGMPMVIGLVRNALALANRFGVSVLSRYQEPTPAARLAAHTGRLMVGLVALLAVGVPSIAVLRPLMDEAYGMGLLGLAVIAVVLLLWRNAGAIEAEYRSGAEELAELLVRQSTGDDLTEGEPGLMPGLETARSIPLRAEGVAVGRTLAELDLRAQTGATVVAIQRGEAKILLPTGRERLEAGDVLAIVGAHEAVRLAQASLARRAEESGPSNRRTSVSTDA